MASTSYAINPKWGESLVGLRMAVPLSWWPGYTGTELSLGKIAKFDAAASPPFLLTVDDELGDTYAVRYDASLVSLCMVKPLSCWPGYTGTELSLGKIAKFDAAASPQFLLAVDDEPGDTYAMRYDAVLVYAQVEHPTFGSFRLPNTIPEELSPDNTVVVRRRGRGRRWRGRKRRCVRARASSPLPPMISRVESAGDDSSDNEDDINNDNDGVP